MKYKVINRIARADIAYEIYGKTLEELFANAAKAVEQTMVDVTTIKSSQNFQFSISNFQLEELLLDFLNELVFLKDSKQLLLSRFDISVRQFHASRFSLTAFVRGEKIDPKRHKLRCDVKAVTRYKLKINKTKGLYKAVIVLDV